MDRHVIHGEAAVTRNDHNAIEHALITEGNRIGSDRRFRTRHLPTDIAGDLILERAYAVERQGAADRDPEVDEGLFADRADAYLLNSDNAGNFGSDGRDFVR